MHLPSEPTAGFPYQIKRLLGSGAMGEVYEAVEPSLDRKVAIKILKRDVLSALPPRTAQEMQQRFLQEARAAAALSNPCVTTIYGVGTYEQTPYIAMEWLDGCSLRELIDEHAPLTVAQATRYMVDLLDALESAHQAGIVHRDIKPANLMVLRNGRLKVTDFGVAHVTNSQLVATQQSAVLGTPLYASPEQLQGLPIDARTDLYAAGVVFYELLTGRVPFESSSLVGLVHMVLNQSLPSAATHNPEVSPEIEQFLYYATARDREQRFASAQQMLDALGHLTASLPLSVTPHQSLRLSALAATAPGGPPAMVPGAMPTMPALPPRFEVPQARDRRQTVAGVLAQWQGRAMGEQDAEAMLHRLLERPLHAEPFEGGVRMGDAVFLIHDGLIHAAFNLSTGTEGDLTYEELPERVECTLYPSPERLPPRAVLSLASLLHPPERLHANLDASFVNLGQLVKKLQAERFDGALVLERADGAAAYLIIRGDENPFNVFAGGWESAYTMRPWAMWLGEVQATAHVEARRMMLPAFAYRQELRDSAFDVQIDAKASPPQIALTPLFMSDSKAHSTMTMQSIYRSDPMYTFLGWMLSQLPQLMRERGRYQGFKYLTTWIERIRKATLHHDLPRPETGLHDAFDLVTAAEDGQVLHLAQHMARADLASFDRFVDRVIEAKTARIKTGDVGGAILVASEFPADTIAAYHERIKKPESRSLLHALQESFTGYEGFVRIGSRRGFHLLLVQERAPGDYALVLPTA